MIHRILLLTTAAVLTALSLPAGAGGSPADTHARDAAGHFERAVKLFGDSDFRAALIEFERAYAIAPNYRVLYDVAMCRYQLHDYAGALGAFERYLSDGDASAIPQRRRENVQSLIGDLLGRVARVRVSTDVVGAQIEVDDVPMGAAPLSSPLVVSVGHRKFAATKNGWPIAVRTVDLAGEDFADVRLMSEAPDGAGRSPATIAATEPFAHHPAGSLMVPAIASFAIALGGFGAGAAFAVAAINDKKDLDRLCVHGACPPSSRSLIGQAQQNADVATVAFSVGLVGAAAGVACLWIIPSRRDTRATGVTLRPLFGVGSMAAILTF